MKVCLLCSNTQECRGADVPFICSACIQSLLKMDNEVLVERYEKAVQDGDERVAYALHSFVPQKNRVPIKRPKLAA